MRVLYHRQTTESPAVPQGTVDNSMTGRGWPFASKRGASRRPRLSAKRFAGAVERSAQYGKAKRKLGTATR